MTEFVYLGSSITREGDEGGPAADWNGQCGVCHTGQSMGFQHSAVEAEVRLVPVAVGVHAAVQCRVLAHA